MPAALHWTLRGTFINISCQIPSARFNHPWGHKTLMDPAIAGKDGTRWGLEMFALHFTHISSLMAPFALYKEKSTNTQASFRPEVPVKSRRVPAISLVKRLDASSAGDITEQVERFWPISCRVRARGWCRLHPRTARLTLQSTAPALIAVRVTTLCSTRGEAFATLRL